MKKILLTVLASASFLVAGIAQAVPTLDIKDFSNNAAGEYFTPAGSQTTSPYYRGSGEDWGWTHGAIAGASGATSITLNISAYDVDEEPCSFGNGTTDCEFDEIFAKDNGSFVSLGFLSGDNNAFSFTNFVLGANFYDDVENGLEVFMKIDESQNGPQGWLVSLGKSVISVDGATLPNPNPTPEPAILGLLGLGLAGIGFVRRRKA